MSSKAVGSKAVEWLKSALPVRKGPRLLDVKDAVRITPNMIRVTFAGDDLADFPPGRESGNCKILLPTPGQSRDDFAAQLDGGPRPVVRTYTVRHHRPALCEVDVDFVAHGDEGPASAWAGAAGPGNFCGFRGPSTAKIGHFEADWYFVAADMSALPMAAATLERMPRDAKGLAVFEVTEDADRQDIDAPPGVEMVWLTQPDPHTASTAQLDFMRSRDWPSGRVQACVAGEHAVAKAFRGFLREEKGLPVGDCYISGYWKIGLGEDEHQAVKRAEAG